MRYHNLARFHSAITLAMASALLGCGGGSMTTAPGGTLAPTPTIAASTAQNGAQIISLSDPAPGATIYYTLDGSAPTTASTPYFAPFLLASSATLKAMAVAPSLSPSGVSAQTFSISIPSGTLVWADDFGNPSGANAQPDPRVWTYDTGNGGWGNHELETYCGWNSSSAPCDPANPNAYIGTDGYLHIVARQPAPGSYTSARLKSQTLFSFQYGRIEARMRLPEGQGLWPAFWLLGNNIPTLGWPACGEQDVMEHINMPSPDWIAGSLHGPSANLGQKYYFSSGQSPSGWHVYGMIWSPGQVQYYVDSPSNVYASFTPASLSGQSGAVWAFDQSDGAFIILNLAVGGNWPGSPDSSTPFPSQVLVSYVHLYSN